MGILTTSRMKLHEAFVGEELSRIKFLEKRFMEINVCEMEYMEMSCI